MKIQNSKFKNQNYNLKFKSFKFLVVVLSFAFYVLSLPKLAWAQTVDPSVWQNNATGLRTTSNNDQKTAGLTTIVKASGVPFMYLPSGVTDYGWGRITGPVLIDLGEIKIPGTTPALTSESADWSHNEMTFSNNLKLWVSRLSPALLIQNLNNSLRLFSGNLSHPAADATTSVPGLPKYVAYSSGGTIRVAQIPASGATPLSLPALDNNWVLVWYGNNAYFADSKSPASVPWTYAYKADAPMLLKFQNNPTSVIQSSEGGIDLAFAGNSGYTSMMPLFGREHLKGSDTEGWGAGLPANVTQKINFWTNKLCSYPTTVAETYAYDSTTDTSTISENITYLNTCAGGSAISGFAILPPMIALAKDALGTNFSLSKILIDAQYSTEFGPIIGIENTNSYSYSVSGLKKYTENKRVITNQNGAPADLIQELTKQVDEATKSGHFRPWIFSDETPRQFARGDIYFLNPADSIYNLTEIAGALPDSSTKTNLINYIKSERTNYPPETVYNLPNTGTLRTPFALNDYAMWQANAAPDIFLKRVPLYSFFSLSKYYDLTGESMPAAVITAAKTALNNDSLEQDWATAFWFKGFRATHSAVESTNRYLTGLIGFTQLTKATGDNNAESLGRALLTKAALVRIAMTKYPRYLYSANIFTPPTEPDWQPRYAGWLANFTVYNWTTPNDDPTHLIILDQFGAFLGDNTGFMSPGTGWGADSEWIYSVSAHLAAYRAMVPETFRLITDFAKQEFEILLNKYTAFVPNWYMNYSEAVLGAEHNINHPVDAYQILMAKSLIQNDTPQNLAKYINVSYLTNGGDFFYMQKLAETIKAYQGVKWEDELAGPTPTPTPCTISSVSWPTGTTSITEGSSVNISVSATGTCSSKSVHLTVRRNITLQPDVDALNQPNPRDVTLTLGAGNTATASATWIADTWSNACLIGTCDPKYFAKANLVGETLETTTDRNNDLTVTKSVIVPTSPNDWPQVQKDAQHTGYSSETLGTNFKVKFTYPFQPERIHPQVQAIIYQGKVFVGTEVGNMYALDAVNPDPQNTSKGKVIWKTTIGEPIVNSVAADNGKIYFGTLNGNFYALDVNTGNQVWKQQLSLDGGFASAPAIADGKILIGGQNGYFYALNPSDGTVIWKYNVGKPIFMTAAYDQTKVFFGAMDMYVYGLNTSDGSLAWKSAKIPGQAFKDYWPIVTQGKVFIIPFARTQEPGIAPGFPFSGVISEAWLTQWGSTIASGNAYSVPDVTNSQNTVMANYQANPTRYTKNMYILDENTGQEAMVVPHWSWQTHSGTTQSPCVDREGKLVVPLEFGTSGWGRLDLNLGRVTDILYDGYDLGGQPTKSIGYGGINSAGFGNGDENYTVSCTKNYILARHVNEAAGGAGYTGVFNLDTRRWTMIGTEGSMSKQMSSNTQGGGTNPFSISNGMVYDIVHHTLLVRSTQ